MAKIEMDVTEWQLMKDKEALLEQALKREKELNDKIQELNQEKIEILKSNEKVVTIEERRSTIETIYTYHSMHNIFEKIKGYFTNSRSYSDRYGHGRTMLDDEMMQTGYDNGNLHNMLDMLFEKKTHEIIDKPIITSKGLDQVRNDIKVEEFNKLEQRVKDDLMNYRKLTIECDTLNKDNSLLKGKVKILTKQIDNFNDQSEKLSEFWTDLSNYKIRMEEFKSSLSVIISENIGLFSIGKFKAKVVSLISEFDTVDDNIKKEKLLLEKAKKQVRKEK